MPADGVTLDVAASDALMRALERQLAAAPGKVHKTAVRVLRRAVRSGKSAMSREIRAVINLKKKRVDRSIRTGVDATGDLSGYVNARNRPIGLIEFMTPAQRVAAIRAARARRSRGVKVKTHKTKGRREYPGAFVAVLPGNRVDVVKRVTRARLPIKKQYGPNLTTEFEQSLPKFAARQAELMQSEMLRILEKNVDIT